MQNSGGFKNEIADHYSNLKEEHRVNSEIIKLRCFNNYIKQILIEKYLFLCQTKPVYVLDLCCGKGGDLKKYKDKVDLVVFVELAKNGLDPNIKFNLINCQYALHYAFESYSRLKRILENVSDLLQLGGLFIGIMTDAEKLMEKLMKVPIKQSNGTNSLEISEESKNGPNSSTSIYVYENPVYEISFDHPSFTKFRHDPKNAQSPPLVGANLRYKLKERVDCTEFLAYFPFLRELVAREYGMHCILEKNVHTFYADEREKGNTEHWKRAQLFKIYTHCSSQNNLHSTKEFDHVNKLMQSKDGASKVTLPLLTISASEWEAIGNYIVFAFRKIK